MTKHPVAEGVTLEGLTADPYPLFAELRASTPVAWAPALERWLVTSRELFLEVVMAPDRFTTESDRSPIARVFDEQMLNRDGQEQQRHRAPFAPAFRGRAVRERMTDSIEKLVESLLDRADLDDGVDLRPLAADLAVLTVAEVLGLVVDDAGRLRAWYEDLAEGLANVSGDPEVFERARATAARFRVDVAQYPAPGSLLDELAQATSEHGLGSYELASNTLLILFGGIETTESVILNTGWALLTHSEQLATVRQDPTTLANAIEESMRRDPAVQTITRFATARTELGGVIIERGDVVECMIGAANRDPAHFDDPDRYDVRRANAADHLGFGHGRHLCLGMHLARLEAQTFWRALLDAAPSLQLVTERAEPPAGHEFRKPPSLWVRR